MGLGSPHGSRSALPYMYFFPFIRMAQGIIKKKVEEKGFGFIAVEGSEDLFFHMSACNGAFPNLREGTTVEFEVEDSPKGKRATNVVPV